MHVRAIALFSPGFNDPRAFLESRSDASLNEPRDVLPARARRGASLVTRMLADVVARATEDAGFDPQTVRTIYASAYGEVRTAVTLLSMQHEGDGQVSPHRFHTSVHNTTSGLVSIANNDRAFSTAVAAGDRTVEMALLEAFTLFHEEPGPIIVAIAEEPVPEALGPKRHYDPLAVAIAITDDPTDAIARVSDLAPRTSEAMESISSSFAESPIASAIPLVRALLSNARQRVALAEFCATIDPPRSSRAGLPAITDLVPHRPPMLLLDEVASYDGSCLACNVVLRDDSPFVEEGHVNAPIALEYMAQCIAAYVGIRGQARGEPVQIGYLIGAREVIFNVDSFSVGDVLRVEVSHAWGDDTLGSFACSVARGDQVVATATLSVYRGDLRKMDLG
jgi:predicted hotdog family 3-hydroxylacyl-ACP dehydratase